MIKLPKKGQAVKMLVWFILGLLVLFFLFFIISKNTEQGFNLIDQIKELLG